MKYGVNLLLWSDDPTREEHLPLYERLQAMGFDGVELPVFDPDPERFAQLGRRLDDLGLERTAVTVRGPGDDPIHPDVSVRREAVALTKRTVDCCAAAGATLLAGPLYAAIGQFSGHPPNKEEWDRSIEVMREVADHSADAGVSLALEFLNRFEIYLLNCAAETARFVRELDCPNVGVHYDTFHAHIEEKSVSAALEACASDLVHVHIAESDRSTPGRGQVNWSETFDALCGVGYDGWLTIEAFGAALPRLAAATKIWRRMFDDEEQLAAEGLAFMRREWARRAGHTPSA